MVMVLTSLWAGAAQADLVGWWKFDDGTGTVAKDSSGNGYDGAVVDATWETGNLGGALGFDGTGYVEVPAESWSTIEMQASVAFWAYGDAAAQPQGGVIVGAYQDPADNESRVISTHVPWSNGNIYLDTGGVLGGPYDRIEKAGDAADYKGTWTHWALVKNAETGDQEIYINGQLWHSGTGMTKPMTDVAKFTIGCKPSIDTFYVGMIDDVRLYDTALTAEELPDIMLGKGPSMGLAVSPSPAVEATDVLRDATLTWGAGEFAATHDVYLGTGFDDVNDASRINPLDVLVSEGQAQATYEAPVVFDYGQTYYWRIDEVNVAPDNTIFKGAVWSFTVEPRAYPIQNVTAASNGLSSPGAGPENTVNGSGLNANDEHSVDAGDMWQAKPVGDEPLYIEYAFDAVYKLHEMLVWNYNIQFEMMLGFGSKDVTVEYSENGADWTVLGDVQLAQGTTFADYTPNTTIDFAGVAAQYVRLSVVSGYGGTGQYGLSEVRFLYLPVNAREAEPADGVADVSIDAVLDWRSGREAVSHEVYLSVDEAAVAEGAALVDVVADARYAPGDLVLASTYYWKVTEVNEAEAISMWEGSLWSFSTQEFVVVDDFESYDDEDNRIYDAWIDGYEVDGNGSQVGHIESPFAEQTIIHGGQQSMPLFYDGATATTSEADLTLAESRNWTRGGITTLTLFFRGEADNTAGQLYAKINGAKVLFEGGVDALSKLRWQQWNIDLASVGANLTNVTTLTIGIEGSGSGMVYVDDLRLYRAAPPIAEPVDPGREGLLLEYTFDGDATDSSGNGYDGTLVGDARVQGGVLVLDGIRDGVSVPLIGGEGAMASQFTISMWMYSTVDLASLDYSGGMNTDGWTAGAMHLKFRYGLANVGISGLDGGDLQGASIGVANAWNHIAVTVSETEIALYLNGGLEDYRVLEAPVEVILGGASLGAWNNGGALQRELTGEMGDVVIYDHALSVGEILFLAGE